jgi:hypothetical protein
VEQLLAWQHNYKNDCAITHIIIKGENNMGSWISDEKGLWHPAKERVGLKNLSGKEIIVEQTDMDGKKFKMRVPAGADYTYEGPDRSAMYSWWEENGRPTYEQIMAMPQGTVTMGSDFKTNDEFMKQFRIAREAHGYQNMDEYLKDLGFDQKKAHETFLKKASVVQLHDLPDRVPEIKKVGGGDDRANSGKNIRYGGWGEVPAEGLVKAG